MSSLGADSGVVVAELIRDGHVESLHRGIVAVVDASGNPLLEAGDTDTVVFPRSTIKPLQSIAALNLGVDFTPLELALATASHCGSLRHRTAVGDMLTRHGLTPDQLQCPPDWPLGIAERVQMTGSEGAPSRLAMNCSGKHAAFLATCKHAGFSEDTYLIPSHPLQVEIRRTIEDYATEKIGMSSTDGCGAPLHALSVRGLARAIARVAAGHDDNSRKVIDAVGTNAWALDGAGRANTITIETLGGIAKIGAEGLVVIGTPLGVAVAVKIIDGSMRATTPVALAALVAVGAITRESADSILAQLPDPVMGGSEIIGGLRVQI